MKNSSFKTNDFLILTENVSLEKNLVKEVCLEKEMIGFTFYASGSMSINISVEKRKQESVKREGIASSFYYSPFDTTVKHEIASSKPLSKLSLFIEPKAFKRIIKDDQLLKQIVNPAAPFVEGQSSYMNHDMYASINKIMNCNFTGLTKTLLLESQATELLDHYMDQISKQNGSKPKGKLLTDYIDKLQYAREIILSRIESPPTLNELSKLSGLNNFKLKTGFKELFGLPVYQFILSRKMELAFKLIQEEEHTVREAAWLVGYDSLGSFSNAFYKKFGIRPSTINK